MPKTTNGRWMSVEELPLKARLRVQYAGRWIAWSEDFENFVAAGDDYESVHEAARQAGVSKPVVEWVPPVPVRPIDAGS